MIVINPQNDEQTKDDINYIKATECRYKETLNESDLKSYESYFNKGCCGSGSNKMTVTLLVNSIIIIIFNAAGLFFLISKNSGYKKYREGLVQALSLVNTSLPDISEMENLLGNIRLFRELYKNETYRTYIYNNCSYDIMRIGLCDWRDYQQYCPYERYINKECNFLDYSIGIDFSTNKNFLCTYKDYSNGLCSYQQYLDYINNYLDGFEYYGGKPKRIGLSIYYYDYEDEYENDITIENVKGISFYNFWCDIGKYDNLIMMSLLIVIAAFIILLIVDLCIKKENISNGIIYYIIVLLYMIFYVVFRIFICLLFCLMIYSIVVTSTDPKPKNVSPLNYSIYRTENDLSSVPHDMWDEKRIYAIIFSGIVFILFIFVCSLDGLSKVIINYLGFNFEENQRKIEINRTVFVNFGEEIYEIEVKNTQNIYLDEVRTRKKIKFKEIKFNKLGQENYYLKLNNKGLIDQLGFSEWDYPNINEGFKRLGEILNLIYVILFFSVLLTKFHVKDEYTYNFLKNAIELGFSVKFSKYYNNYGYLEKTITDFRLYIYIILSIIILLFMIKRAFFGGFKYTWLFWIFFIISILFALLNLGILLLTILIDIYSWLSLIAFINNVNFSDEEIVIAKFSVQGSINVLIILLELVVFIKSITYSAFIFSMNSEINGIINKNENIKNINMENREEGFEFTALDSKSYYFQAINKENFPKYLFYFKSVERGRRIFISENQRIYRVGANDININNNISSERNNLNNLPFGYNNNNNQIKNIDYIYNNNNHTNCCNDDITNNNLDNNNSSLEILELQKQNQRIMKENDDIRKKILLVKTEIEKILRPQ